MEKAYDLKVLAVKLKEKGLPEMENLAEKVYEATKEWYVESAVLSDNKVDDVTVPFIGFVDAIVKPQIDKIDGIQG
jgi:hypothetical protein